jgi:hypothetical protein
MVKVTDYNELENLAEFYIFIWGTAPGGDEDINQTLFWSDADSKMRKLFRFL